MDVFPGAPAADRLHNPAGHRRVWKLGEGGQACTRPSLTPSCTSRFSPMSPDLRSSHPSAGPVLSE